MLRKGTIYMVPKPKLGGDSLSFLHPSSLGQTVLPPLHLLSLIWFYLLFEILLTYNNDLESDGFLFLRVDMMLDLLVCGNMYFESYLLYPFRS